MDHTDPIIARILELIAEEAGRPVDQIQAEHAFATDLGFDSLGQVELVMAMEDEFELSIDEAEADKIRTVADAIATVRRLRSARDVA